MGIRIGINGFGRIGRQSLRAMMERYPRDVEVDPADELGVGALDQLVMLDKQGKIRLSRKEALREQDSATVTH